MYKRQAEHQTLRQRLRARLLARLAGRGEDAPGEAQLAAEALAGKQFTFGKNNKGLLPMVIAVMNDWYTRGVDGIAFRKEEGQLWMDWTESGQLQRVPLGLSLIHIWRTAARTLPRRRKRWCT